MRKPTTFQSHTRVPGFTVVETFPPDYSVPSAEEISRLRSCEEAMLEGSEIIIELRQELSSLRLATIEECAKVAKTFTDFCDDVPDQGSVHRRTAHAILDGIRDLAKDRGEANPLEKAARIADHAAEMADKEGRTRCEQDLRAVAMEIRTLKDKP